MRRDAGFSLLELLLACSFGLVVFGSAAHALLSEQGLGSRLGARLRQRQLLLRVHQLIAADVARGIALAPGLVSPCHLAGRTRWLQLLNADGSITTYSMGSPPSAIWQGQVLMRCGPTYRLDGQIKAGSTSQNRVVLDGLAPLSDAWTVCSLPQAEVLSDASVCWEPASGLVQWQLPISSNGISSQKAGQALLQG